MSTERARRKYDEAFKREAVRLVEDEGMKASQVERDLGISTGLVGRWKKLIKEDGQHPFPGSGYQRPEQAELTRLKRENDRLRRERDILKKAMAIFSEDQ
jgi:transposase